LSPAEREAFFLGPVFAQRRRSDQRGYLGNIDEPSPGSALRLRVTQFAAVRSGGHVVTSKPDRPSRAVEWSLKASWIDGVRDS